jgi:hypothetical protein
MPAARSADRFARRHGRFRRRRRCLWWRSIGAPFPVEIRIDAHKTTGELKPVWRFFGADEPNYATMKDGRKLDLERGEWRLLAGDARGVLQAA